MNRPPKLFVGIGNVLCHDDGIGVRAAERMAQLALPSGIEVFEAGTVGLDVASVLESRELVVFADAIEAGAAPGTIFRMRPEELRAMQSSGVSLHDLNLLDALAETRLTGRAPDRVIALAVQAADTSPGIGLTLPVRRALPRLLRMALRELGVSRSHLAAARRRPFALTEG